MSPVPRAVHGRLSRWIPSRAVEPATTRPAPVPIVQSAVEPTTRIFVGRAYDMTTPQLSSTLQWLRPRRRRFHHDGLGRKKQRLRHGGVLGTGGRSSSHRSLAQKRHPRWSKLIGGAGAAETRGAPTRAASKRAVVAGTRARAASVERADAARAKRLCAPRPRRRELRGSRRRRGGGRGSGGGG